MRITKKIMSQIINYFGPYKLNKGQIFLETCLSIGIVNIKPIVPGHILIIPKRVVPRMKDLTSDEIADLFATVHKVSPIIEDHYGCTSSNIAVQDGVMSGQSVPHVHVHILPRKLNDFKNNDDIYTELEDQKLDKEWEKERKIRSIDEMTVESTILANLFKDI